MLKITLPNGVIIEGEGTEITSVVEAALRPNVTSVPVSQPTPEPVTPEPEKVEPVNQPAVETIQPQLHFNAPGDYPHKYAAPGRAYVGIGEREDQILQICKMVAEEKGFRHAEFRTMEVLPLVDGYSTGRVTVTTVNSAFQSLLRKGLLRHGGNRRLWYVTPQGYNSHYRVIAPMRKSV